MHVTIEKKNRRLYPPLAKTEGVPSATNMVDFEHLMQ